MSSEDLRPQPQQSKRCRMRPVRQMTGLFLCTLNEPEALEAFYEDFSFRSFHLSKAAALCRAQHFHDDHHLDLQHRRRFFRFELRRQEPLRRAEPHLPRHHGARRLRLYDRHGRQRAHRQNARRGQAKRGKRDLLHARRGARGGRRCAERRVPSFSSTHLLRRRRDRPHDR